MTVNILSKLFSGEKVNMVNVLKNRYTYRATPFVNNWELKGFE